MMREGVRCERKRLCISLQKRLEVMPSDVLEATTYSLSTSQGSYNARAFIGILSVLCKTITEDKSVDLQSWPLRPKVVSRGRECVQDGCSSRVMCENAPMSALG